MGLPRIQFGSPTHQGRMRLDLYHCTTIPLVGLESSQTSNAAWHRGSWGFGIFQTNQGGQWDCLECSLGHQYARADCGQTSSAVQPRGSWGQNAARGALTLLRLTRDNNGIAQNTIIHLFSTFFFVFVFVLPHVFIIVIVFPSFTSYIQLPYISQSCDIPRHRRYSV